MIVLTIDDSLPQKLLSLTEPADLCDATGRVVGRFVPVLERIEYDLEPPISPEELQRRRQLKGKGYTTAEVIAYLKKLDCDQ